MSHFRPTQFDRLRHEKDPDPIQAFVRQVEEGKMDRAEWTRFFEQITKDSIQWKLSWWNHEEILFRCGRFLNVPLPGVRGVINCNPSLTLRQHAFCQKVPAEEYIQPLEFFYDDESTQGLSKEVTQAWKSIFFFGRPHLGVRTIGANPDYYKWLEDRVKGIGLTFSTPDPLVGEDVHLANKLLAEQIMEKEAKIIKMAEKESVQQRHIEQLQTENISLQDRITRDKGKRIQRGEFPIQDLLQENKKLRRSLWESRALVEKSDQRMRIHIKNMNKILQEKSKLEKQLGTLPALHEAKKEKDFLSTLLVQKNTELLQVRTDMAQAVAQLRDQLGEQKELTNDWKTLHGEEMEESKYWRVKLWNVFLLVNSFLPKFTESLTQAENMINPMDTPMEIEEFFTLCNQLMNHIKEFN